LWTFCQFYFLWVAWISGKARGGAIEIWLIANVLGPGADCSVYPWGSVYPRVYRATGPWAPKTLATPLPETRCICPQKGLTRSSSSLQFSKMK